MKFYKSKKATIFVYTCTQFYNISHKKDKQTKILTFSNLKYM